MEAYAVVLYFDSAATEKLRCATAAIAGATGNTALLDAGIPPHVTVAAFSAEDEAALIKAVDEFASHAKRGSVLFECLHGFAPKVLFAAPRKDDYLRDLNQRATDILIKDFQPGDNNYYLPHMWSPHCALALQLNETQYETAQKAAEMLELPFTAQAEKIVLARSVPYVEVAEWELKK